MPAVQRLVRPTLHLAAATLALLATGQVRADTAWIADAAHKFDYKLTDCADIAACRASAAAQGATLAVIPDRTVQKFIYQNFSSYGPAFFAASDLTDGVWRWEDGTPLTWTYWCPNEPNNQGGEEFYAMTNWSTNGCWNDGAAASLPRALIQRPHLPSVAGTVSDAKKVKVTCSNTSTGQSVSAEYTGNVAWNCADMGLVYGRTDQIKTTVISTLGTVKTAP